jgi:hypothetical protein
MTTGGSHMNGFQLIVFFGAGIRSSLKQKGNYFVVAVFRRPYQRCTIL